MMESITLFFVLMAAPSPTDDHVMNYAIPLSIHDTALDCAENKSWIDEQKQNLPRHLFCMPVKINMGEPV